jgi:ATP-dependent protease Clp ATPase subunit
MKRDLGARGLHIALEEALINAQFEAPSMVIKPKQIILNSINIKTKIPFWFFNIIFIPI